MNLKSIIVGSLVSLGTVGAFAQQSPVSLGVEGGFAVIDQETRALANAQTIANLSGLTTTVRYDQSTYAGRVFLALSAARDVDVEVGYFMTGSLDTTYTNSAGSAQEGYTASGFDVSFVLKPQNLNGLFLKAGVHSSEVEGKASVTIGGTTYAISATESGTGWLLGGGYEWQFGATEDLLARAAYTFYNRLGGMSDGDAGFFSLGLTKRF